jgi:hypothetical protein
MIDRGTVQALRITSPKSRKEIGTRIANPITLAKKHHSKVLAMGLGEMLVLNINGFWFELIEVDGLQDFKVMTFGVDVEEINVANPISSQDGVE